MQATTIRQANEIAGDVLVRGLSYRQAGARQGISRSTAERQFKALVRLAASQSSIGRLRDLDLCSLALLRSAREDVLRAVEAYDPSTAFTQGKQGSTVDLDAAARRVRIQSGNVARDVALLHLAISTGARPLQIAQLQVSDYLDQNGDSRDRSTALGFAGQQRAVSAVSFRDARLRVALDAYLEERRRRGFGVTGQAKFRGLCAASMLFLTRDGRPFNIKPRAANDPRPACPVLGALLRRILAQAGMTKTTTNTLRKHLAQRLVLSGATDVEICEALGIVHPQSVSRLLNRATPSTSEPRLI